ncbi:MAG TPA: hypothetical protein VK841_06935 [Polyangiaceae bacterium]|nr:hypothetical protein [Polyangiaceae bacterium]
MPVRLAYVLGIATAYSLIEEGAVLASSGISALVLLAQRSDGRCRSQRAPIGSEHHVGYSSCGRRRQRPIGQAALGEDAAVAPDKEHVRCPSCGEHLDELLYALIERHPHRAGDGEKGWI